jgi:hypothetical protein
MPESVSINGFELVTSALNPRTIFCGGCGVVNEAISFGGSNNETIFRKKGKIEEEI